jgi:hypothetical protein
MAASGLSGGVAQGAATPCSYAGGYPGDSAAKAMLVAWMASGAIRAALPAELPVMGALVESGVQNLPAGDSDSAGFFQMRVSIWDKGDYAGFTQYPDLQVKWFTDQALAVNQSRTGAGTAPYGEDSNLWGEWVADVLRPPAQYRYRYQLRLDEARQLIAAGCGSSGGSTPLPSDSTAPTTTIAGKRSQDPVRRRAIVVEVACPAEACVASARASLSLPGAARIYKLRSSARVIPKGGKVKLKLRVRTRARRALKRALARRRHLRVKVLVTAKDAAGNATTAARKITLRHRGH